MLWLDIIFKKRLSIYFELCDSHHSTSEPWSYVLKMHWQLQSNKRAHISSDSLESQTQTEHVLVFNSQWTHPPECNQDSAIREDHKQKGQQQAEDEKT